jgi:hypothetical protein
MNVLRPSSNVRCQVSDLAIVITSIPHFGSVSFARACLNATTICAAGAEGPTAYTIRANASEVMAGNRHEELASVCVGCHNVIHLDDFGNRRTAEEEARVLSESKTDICFPAPKYDLRKTTSTITLPSCGA